MNIKKNGKINVLIILVILTLSLIPIMNFVSASYNWVEWDGYVYDDWGNGVEDAIVRLKYGSTTLDSDLTDSNGYYLIREYVDNSKRYTLKASINSNWTTQQYDNLLGRPEGGGPWRYNFDLYYVQKWAVVVGIDNYSNTSDLVYCENDADDWYNELTSSSSFDFDYVEMYQDSSSGCDGRAEEGIVKDALVDMVSDADGGDIIAFIFSGHGYENTSSSHALTMWDYQDGRNGEDGLLYDTEITAIVDDSIAERVFLFFDACYGGSFSTDIDGLSNSNQFYLSGGDQGNDTFVDAANYNGCWTQCFLNEAYIDEYNRDITRSFEDIHLEARSRYDDHEADLDQYYDANQHGLQDNNYGSDFCLSKYGITPS